MWVSRLAIVVIPIAVGLVILWAIQRGLISFPSGDLPSPTFEEPIR